MFPDVNMNPRPKRIEIDFDSIPKELIDQRNWVLWRWERRNGKLTKPPYQASGKLASSSDQSTWNNTLLLNNIFPRSIIIMEMILNKNKKLTLFSALFCSSCRFSGFFYDYMSLYGNNRSGESQWPEKKYQRRFTSPRSRIKSSRS